MKLRRDERGDATEVLTFFGMVVGVILVIALCVALLIGSIAVFRSFGRSQARADARNKVAISTIQIRNQAQQILVHKQQAQIRLQDAIGVREAQDEIAKTLTPLYVQFEMVDALRQIATSGSNNSVVYIPAGANGIPLVSNVAGSTQVGEPNK